MGAKMNNWIVQSLKGISFRMGDKTAVQQDASAVCLRASDVREITN